MAALFDISFPLLFCQGSESLGGGNLFSEWVPLTSLHPLELALQTHPELVNLMSDSNSVKLNEGWPSHHVCLSGTEHTEKAKTRERSKA